MASGNIRQIVKISRPVGYQSGFKSQIRLVNNWTKSNLSLATCTSTGISKFSPISNGGRYGNLNLQWLRPISVGSIQGNPSTWSSSVMLESTTTEQGSGFRHESSFSKVWMKLLVAGGVMLGGSLLLAHDSTVEAASKDAPTKSFDPADPVSSMLLYWASGSPPCWRVILALEEKGLKGYPNEKLLMSNQEQKSAEVLKLNPRGQVPTFRHGNNVINESLAIVDYIEMTFPDRGTRLLPTDPAKRAFVLQRKYEALVLFSKGIEGHVFYSFRKPEDKTQGEIDSRLKAFREELAVWENHLKQLGPDSYIAGKDFSMADVIFFPTLALLWRLGLNLDKYPNIRAYFEKTCQRKSVQNTWPPHWKEGPRQKYIENV